LLAAMEELGRIENIATPAPVFLPFFDSKRRDDYLRLAAQVRRAGIGVEFYPEAKKLGKQLQYADKRGFRVALIAGENELAAGECQVKDLATGGSTTASTANEAAAVIAEIQQILSP
jgi:histidyl-tRNA synthetase